MFSASLASLSEREKIVITLRLFEKLTLAEVGEVLGMTTSKAIALYLKAVDQILNYLYEQERIYRSGNSPPGVSGT
jgi:RNA polymerase sigma factor for flagellar operon FliA